MRRDAITDADPRADDLSNYKVCLTGDLVVNRMSAYQGALGAAPSSGLVSPDYLILRPASGVHPPYLHHVGRSAWFIAEMTRLLRGIGSVEGGNVRTPRINWEDMASIELQLPTLEEQRRVADFLDGQVALLDRAIHLRQQQIELKLEGESAALTQTFDDLVKAHGSHRLAHVVRRMEQGWSPQCDEGLPGPEQYGVLKAGCVNGGAFDAKQVKALPAGLEPRLEYLLRPGDFLMCRASGSLDLIGSAALVPSGTRAQLLLCDKVYRLRLDSSVSQDFYVLLMRARPIREAIKLGTSGAEGMANNLPSGTVRGLRFPSAPRSVQAEIVDRLMALRTEGEQARSLMSRQLELLRERKQALITAAVAGEFDVSTASARSVA